MPGGAGRSPAPDYGACLAGFVALPPFVPLTFFPDLSWLFAFLLLEVLSFLVPPVADPSLEAVLEPPSEYPLDPSDEPVEGLSEYPVPGLEDPLDPPP